MKGITIICRDGRQADIGPLSLSSKVNVSYDIVGGHLVLTVEVDGQVVMQVLDPQSWYESPVGVK